MSMNNITEKQASSFGRAAHKSSRWGGQLHFEMLDGHLSAMLINAGVHAPEATAFAMNCVNKADGHNTHGAGAFGAWVAHCTTRAHQGCP